MDYTNGVVLFSTFVTALWALTASRFSPLSSHRFGFAMGFEFSCSRSRLPVTCLWRFLATVDSDYKYIIRK